MFRPLNKVGFSLAEVVVAGVIFSIAVAGVFASLAAIKSVPTDKKLGAALCGQAFMEGLRASVDNADWTTGKLMVQNTTAANCVQNGITYSIAYVITVAGAASRKAVVTVTWP